MMKTLKRNLLTIAALFAPLFGGGQVATAQINTLTQTSTAAAVAATDKVVYVTSATNINAPSPQSGIVASQIYVVAPGNQRGELMLVTSVNGTAISVRRNASGAATSFPSGSMVLAGNPNWFYGYDPSGGCVAANTLVTPYVNTKTGNEWLCSTVTSSWVPGFGNDAALDVTTAAVASAAGLVTPSGPLFHVTGTAAITGFNIPVGFAFGSFCAIPDGIFTTTATTNIALASTAVVSRVNCWTYDPATAKFYPGY
jgi:hypothetical protein